VKPFDTVEFCKLLGIDRDGFNKRWIKSFEIFDGIKSVFEKQLTAETYASVSERLSEFPGFSAVTRYLRNYPDSVAAQFLGYIGEVQDKDIKRSTLLPSW